MGVNFRNTRFILIFTAIKYRNVMKGTSKIILLY
jgi:hypothetical protein